MKTSFTKNPTNPNMINPKAVLLAMSVNSRRSGFVHFFTNLTESFMNSFSGAMAMSATSIFNNEMCFSLFLFPKSLTFFYAMEKKRLKFFKNQTHLRRRRC